MTKSRTNEQAPPPRPWSLRLVATLLVGTLLACFVAAASLLRFPKQEPAAERGAAIEMPRIAIDSAPSSDSDATIPAKPKLVAVDAPLWASPTDGPPLDLAWLPPGVQIVAAIRPTAIAAHAEGEKVMAALGPLGQKGLRALEHATGRPFGDWEQLVVGWQTSQAGAWEVAIVATASNEGRARSSERQGAGGGEQGAGALEVYEPSGREGRVIVVASPVALEEIKALDGRAPPLRRALQQLVDVSDHTRDFTLLVAPSYLFGDGHSLFAGETARLRGPLSWFLGDGLAAASLSLHWDDDFFVELRAVPSLDWPTDVIAGQLLGRVEALPDAVSTYLGELDPHQYGRNVLARLPSMVRQLAAHTRAAYDGDAVVLRAYLPVAAGHNLLMGSELVLAEPPQARLVNQPRLPTSIEERLNRRTTLRFPRDTLEAALDMLAQDLGLEIILLGSDLQLEGITKNQSLGLDLADRPGREILVEILRQANLDKSANGPADERQRLVYVIKPRAPGQAEAIFVTTRAQARRRGDRLPDVFESQQDEQLVK